MKKSILVPFLTIFVAAAVLFGVAAGLTGVASANAQKEHLEMMRLLLPDSETFTLEPYSGDDANIRSVHKAENGYIIETCCYGYAGILPCSSASAATAVSRAWWSGIWRKPGPWVPKH